jgi:hypothetical protein
MGAKTVAGAIRTEPIWTESGTWAFSSLAGEAPAPHGAELSQNFFKLLFYLSVSRELPVQVRERRFQHFAVLGVRGGLKLLQDSFPRKLQPTAALFPGDLLWSKLLAWFRRGLGVFLLLFD